MLNRVGRKGRISQIACDSRRGSGVEMQPKNFSIYAPTAGGMPCDFLADPSNNPISPKAELPMWAFYKEVVIVVKPRVTQRTEGSRRKIGRNRFTSERIIKWSSQQVNIWRQRIR